MSGKNFNEPYEDELDRMRTRRRKTSPARQRRRFDAYEDDFGNDWDFQDDFNEDFIVEDLDNDFLDDGLDNGFAGSGRGARNNGRKKNQYHTGYGSGYGAAHGGNRNSSYKNVHRSTRQGRTGKSAKKRRKKAPVLFILCCILLLSAGGLYAKRWMKDRDGYWNIAVFGVDSRDGGLEKGALADVQMIASINKKTGEIRLVSLYRDTYVQINDDGDFHKINEAYFKGGHKQALETLKRNMDIEVDDYATFNWKAVADGINILGGVDLEITESEFAYINSFITATVESTGIGSFQLEHPGLNHLDGVQAVAYSRLRLMDTDYNRTERQRKVVSLALEKAKQADFKTLSALTGVVLSEISTSIGVEDVIPLAKSVNRYYLGQTGGFPFAKTTTMVGKLDCVIPMTLESNVVFLHQFLFDQEGYQPSTSVKKISGIISERTGIYEEGKSAGADTNLTGVVGNSGKISSNGNSSGGNSSGQKNSEAAPEPQPIQTENSNIEEPLEKETEGSSTEGETETEPETEETKALETTEERTTESEKETTTPSVEPLVPEETTLSPEQIHEGPGFVNPLNSTEANGKVNPVKPTEAPTQEVGPGFSNPEANEE